jgi:hypothetical protein
MLLKTHPIRLHKVMTRLRLVAALNGLLLLAACSSEDPTAVAPRAAEEVQVAPTAKPAPVADSSPVETTDAVLLEEVEIKDPMRGEMAAYRLLVPKGWAVEGGLSPVAPAFYMIPCFSQVTVRAPDGRGAIFWGPVEFGYADGVPLQHFTPLDGRPYFPLQASLGDYWMKTFELSPAKGVTKLEIVSESVRPEATKYVRKMLAPLYESTRQENAQLAGIGESKEFDVEARELVVRYEEDGLVKEATIFATWRHAIYRYMDGSVRAAMWNLDHMYCVFGPVGTQPLEDPVLAAVVRSRKEVPEWQQAIQRWYLEKNQEIVAQGLANLAAAARASAASRATQTQDVLDISFQGWKNRNAANDAGHSSSINGIHERTTFATPTGGTVDLPSHYQNVYTDGQGNYVLHNDANYQINTDPVFRDRDWQRIEAQR